MPVRKSLLVVPVIALLAAGCGSSKKSTTAAPAPQSTSTPSAGAGVMVSTKTVAGLGQILVNGQGKTLYVFKPDNAKKVTCTGSCAAVWPPLKLTGGAKPAASGAVKASLLSSDPDPSGGQVATYNGWPLYTYVSDTGPGTANGQALNLNGGLWYVISSTGQVITKKASS